MPSVSEGVGRPSARRCINLSITPDGTFIGDIPRQQEQVRLVRGLVARGGHFNPDEATDLHQTWTLRRALYDGPVDTVSENRLVWRIVTHDRGDSKPFNPLTDKFPPRREGPAPFVVKESEMQLLNRPTRLHGTPLYAALLMDDSDALSVIIKVGGRLSAARKNAIPPVRARCRRFWKVTPRCERHTAMRP